jgi:glycosyltransferase involved in cell wall biosynthesis
MGIMDKTLERARRAPSVLDVVALADTLAHEAATAGAAGGAVARSATRALVEATDQEVDAPTAIAAVHALARMPPDASLERFRDLLDDGGWLAPHAAWALADRVPDAAFLEPLAGLVEQGRLGGMLAQRTLARWAARLPGAAPAAVRQRLEIAMSPPGRARLVETLGLVDGSSRDLLAIAHGSEPPEVRSAAIAALGDRPGAATRELEAVAAAGGPAGEAAQLALVDQRIALEMDAHPAEPAILTADGDDDVDDTDGSRTAGERVRVAQVHLPGHLDHALAHAGEGSTGGVATLLVQLGDALTHDPRVARVITMGRGSAAEALAGLAEPVTRTAPSGDQHVVLPAPFGRHEGASFSDAWPAVIAAERGIRRILAEHPASLLHLRMADVGSLAASRIARRQGLPTVFTLAPDPHAVIVEMERSGELGRASFGPADAAGALWYRLRLVRYLADTARHIVLFPRPDLAARLRDLLAIDITAEPERYHVVPEGIDPVPVRAARREIARRSRAVPRIQVSRTAPAPTRTSSAVGSASPGVLVDLQAAVVALGNGRRGLPLVISVGRLAEVKGMARLVEAFAADAALRQRANLVIVGGDLDDPTPEERAEMERIEAVLVRHPEMAEGLVLLGHRPHDDVLRVLAAAEAGLGPEIARGGAYACGSRKEEFGLAIVEALAVGLPVVAPQAGGPPSYVEDGVTGRLVDTLDRAALAAAIGDALDLARRHGRADRARSLVAQRFSIRAMSDALIPIYGAARRAAAPPVPV